MLVLGLLVVLGSGLAQETRKLYSGYQMIRAQPETPEQLKLVESLQEAVDAWTPVVTPFLFKNYIFCRRSN